MKNKFVEKAEKIRRFAIRHQNSHLKLMKMIVELKQELEKLKPYKYHPRNKTNKIWRKIKKKIK